MNKIVEKGVMMMLTMGMIVLAGTNCYAAEIEKSEVTAKDITISREAEYPIVDRVGINDGKMRASYGEEYYIVRIHYFQSQVGMQKQKHTVE